MTIEVHIPFDGTAVDGTVDLKHDDPDVLAAALASDDSPLRLRGGKGGFGSMLRAQGGKMSSQKTTNFEACRDLSGRRLKTVNDAKKLAEYMAKEPERKRKQRENAEEKIKEGLKEQEPKKIRIDENEFLKDHEKALEDVKDTVERALKKSAASKKAATKPQKKAVW
ncbi:telomere stability and silencing-domain-containing protein [Zopfochytrium polystomum]|nr:telomere stability and silencing-domain-containing protein [Zopfochytrium polystomum]